jgi:hypothetical protein
MSDIKSKVTERIDEAVDATKKAASTIIDKSKDLVHPAGQTLDEGKRLKGV